MESETRVFKRKIYDAMLKWKWKIQSELTPRANVALTPEYFSF